MSAVRLIPASLELDYEIDNGNAEFIREFNMLTLNEEDPLGAWLKRAKSRGETKESDQVILTLLIELHRKVDELSDYVKNNQKQYLSLENSTKIASINFEYIGLDEPKFEVDKIYYGRILMPIFPKRNIAIYFQAIDEKTAKIVHMHDEDVSDWSAYVTARERVMIRDMKVNKD
ncbi:hypothetical protein KDE13_03735 [Campylobacter sp. faydin G-140]|uniref:hypothetical protein n=1 Tax=Campylobacter anatolicus TaxID=2829105 RepID=UPI001B926860|nr:hypothetical protein [Campylobacter anatolicus]MBR8465471.1 hypothetical protein [Campylobacter anatolicus]